jgi:glucose-6-phosphate 1-dehydrogenase
MRPPNHVIVVFGANGDLSKRKLIPALYHLQLEGLMPVDYRVIGSSRSELSDQEFRSLALQAVEDFGECEINDDEWNEFARRLSYLSHDVATSDPTPLRHAVEKAEAEMGNEPQRLFYLSVPPPAFGTITSALGAAGLQARARVVYEKPFGVSLDGFEELSREVHDVLDESQVYRIDHFLGKETVQNILAFRFANGMFEPSWNRHHIDHVQIEVLEEIGIGSRAGFYDKTGALRDMLVTHLFQLLGFVAMEPPPFLEARPLAEEVLKLFDSMKPLGAGDVVRGQYEGYSSEEGVAPDSDTETFAAARVFIDNWRWAGVPFYLRTGKALKQRRSSVTLAFRDPPRQMFRETSSKWFKRDHLSLELGPEEGISITFLTKLPGPTIELGPASMVFKYEGSFGSEMIGAYERLIHDALIGDRTLFTRGDGIERAWELVDYVLKEPPPLHLYKRGSWGPLAGDELIAPRRWHSTSRADGWN